MSDNNSLNDKYKNFEPEQEENEADVTEVNIKIPKAKKKKAEKKPKEPKEKKIKEPKEKKEKEPKEKKPKEKKVKPPKKDKKKRERGNAGGADTPKTAENTEIDLTPVSEPESAPREQAEEPIAAAGASEETIAEETVSDENMPQEEEISVKNGRHIEEIIYEGGFSQDTGDQKRAKAKKPKKPKTPKEKKIKEPKEKKIKEPKEKKDKPKKEKKKREPLQKKDIFTIALSFAALILVACTGFFAYFNSRTDEKKVEIVSKISFLGKIFPEYVINEGSGEDENKNKLSTIQIARDGVIVNLIQTDFPNVFYGINTDYSIQYYQYSNGKIVPVKYTDSIDLKVDMGSGILNVKMNYVKNGEYLSGVSVYTSNKDDGVNYFYDLVVFKLTVLPPKYNKEGHALLLASTDKSALEGNDSLWAESFDVNLSNGSMTRFLSVVNRNIDEKGAGVFDFCILNRAGYTSTMQKIPFISSREYPSGSGMQDIFVKDGAKEERLASNVYGRYLTADSSKIVYLRKTTTGFDVIHNTNGEEKIARSFYGSMDTGYMINGDYLLSKEDGRLYNIVTGKDYSLVGYSMNATSFAVSADSRYVVMMGTVKNAVDYQIHIFDLQTGEYAKFQDKNYAPHGTLCYIDENTVLYTAVDPNQGFEYVVLDVSKAFEQAK